jgi:hypothetical protein
MEMAGLKLRRAGAILAAIVFALACCALQAADNRPDEADAAPMAFDAEQLIEKLQQSIGATVNVELKSGASFVRAKLLRITFDRKKGLIRTIGLQDAETGKARNVGFAVISSIRLDRETIYTAPTTNPRSSADRRSAQRAEEAAELRSQWVERAKANGVEPWPELTKEEHEAAIAEHRKLIDEVSRAMPGMALYETHEFLFFSNIPPNQITPYTTALDAMHDMMCRMYGIKPGEPVWKGKCLVVAFLNKAEFMRFEQTFLQNKDPSGAYGTCHPFGDGRVIISCYRGDRPEDFAKMLVHETSHGFIHRYRTPVHPPSWINEGMADWIGRSLIPKSRSVPLREAKALAMMRQTGNMGGSFLTRKSNIDAWQYGIASSLTDFLIRQNAAAYTRFIQGIKEGLTWQESLQEYYEATPEALIAAYGKAIGVPNLRE